MEVLKQNFVSSLNTLLQTQQKSSWHKWPVASSNKTIATKKTSKYLYFAQRGSNDAEKPLSASSRQIYCPPSNDAEQRAHRKSLVSVEVRSSTASTSNKKNTAVATVREVSFEILNLTGEPSPGRENSFAPSFFFRFKANAREPRA